MEVGSLLVHLAARDHQTRSQAEKILFGEWLEGSVEVRSELLASLAQLAAQGDVAHRSFAAVVFRRCALKMIRNAASSTGWERAIDAISPEALAQSRHALLAGLLAPEQARDTRHKLSDAVAEIARDASPWPEVLVALAEAVKSPDAVTRECAFRVFATNPGLVEGSEELIQGATRILEAGFSDPSEEVRVAATTAFSAFFAGLPKSAWAQFKPLLPSLLRVMEPLRVERQGDELAAVLESLIELAELAPKMFRPLFAEVIKFSLAVAQDREMDEGARVTALEFATTFADEAPQMCRKEPTYVPEMVVGLLQMLLEVGIDDEDGSEWNEEDDLGDGEEEVHAAAKMAIDRLALALGDALAPPLFEFLPKLANSTGWRERHACLIALSNIAEGCREVLLPEMPAIVTMIVPMLQDGHPRVQWAACNALGQLSTDFAPEIQQRHSQEIVPALVSKLTPESVFKVQAHAAAAVVNFAEEATREQLEPYLDDMLSRLLTLLRGPKRYVQEQVLTTIAIVADAAQQQFGKYCDTLMPLLLEVITTDMPREFRLLKAKAIECATLIALAVGKQQFAPYFPQLVQIFAQIQQEPADEDDPCQSYLVQAWGRICRVVGRDFLPYLPGVMPPLLAAAKAQADVQVLDEDQAQNVGDDWEVVPFSGHWVGLNTAQFEEKANAIELLQVYATELKADFWPWVPEIVSDVVVPGLDFAYNIHVREVAIQLVPMLMAAANGAAPQDSIELWRPLLSRLMTLVKNVGLEPGLRGEVFLAIGVTARTLGPAALDPESIQLLVHFVGRAVHESRVRFEERPHSGHGSLEDRRSGEDEFEEDIDEDEAISEDESLLDNANRLIHFLFHVYGAEFYAVFQALMPVIQQCLGSSSPDAQEFALCALADMIQYAPVPAAGAASSLAAPLLQALGSSSGRVRQSAAFALGHTAQLREFDAFRAQFLPALFVVAREPHVDDHDAAETAVSALARFLRHNSDPESVAQWIQTLPVVEDKEAAAFSYAWLSELMDKQHPAVIQNAPKAVLAVAQALVARSVEGKNAERLLASTKALLGSMPQDQAMQLLQQLPPEDQEVIKNLFS